MVNGRGQSEGKEEAKMTTSAMPMLIMAAIKLVIGVLRHMRRPR
jgi:hypothetical protein